MLRFMLYHRQDEAEPYEYTIDDGRIAQFDYDGAIRRMRIHPGTREITEAFFRGHVMIKVRAIQRNCADRYGIDKYHLEQEFLEELKARIKNPERGAVVLAVGYEANNGEKRTLKLKFDGNLARQFQLEYDGVSSYRICGAVVEEGQ